MYHWHKICSLARSSHFDLRLLATKLRRRNNMLTKLGSNKLRSTTRSATRTTGSRSEKFFSIYLLLAVMLVHEHAFEIAIWFGKKQRSCKN